MALIVNGGTIEKLKSKWLSSHLFTDGWDGARNNFVNGYHDNRMNAGNSFNRGPPRMERGRGGVGGYRGNRSIAFNPMNQAQQMGFPGYETKGGLT